MSIKFSQLELAAVLRAQARRTTVRGRAFLPDEGDAARGLQYVDREAAIAGDTVFAPQTTGYVKSVDFHAREGQAPSGRLFLTGADHHQPTGKAQKPSLPYGIALGIRQYGRLGF